MKIRKLQRELERIYHLERLPAVDRFLVSKEELRRYVPISGESRPQVLVKEVDGEILCAVHVGDETMKRFERSGARYQRWSDFLSVAEEVSHFVYLLWNARNGRQVRLLDVELQGEIDKYVLAARRLENTGGLIDRLFHRVSFYDEMPTTERSRYREANRLGEKFCRSIQHELGGKNREVRALSRLREFYRWATHKRMDAIARL